jgi:DNA polymerase
LAGQHELVSAFAEGRDVYKIMAGKIYDKTPEHVTEDERFVGKTTILGAGYGMGAVKFQMQLKNFGVHLDLTFCQKVLETYRAEFSLIQKLWRQANDCITTLAESEVKAAPFGIQPQATYFLPGVGFDMPSGIPQKYPGIRFSGQRSDAFRNTPEIVYDTRKGPNRIYGGKVVENICQGLARCVIGEQMLKVAKRYKVVLTVHDAVACIAPVAEAEEAARYVRECMRWRPEWAKTLPLDCEVKMGYSYGGAQKIKFN